MQIKKGWYKGGKFKNVHYLVLILLHEVKIEKGKWGLLWSLQIFIYWFYLPVLKYSNILPFYIFKLSLHPCIKLSFFFNFLLFSICPNIPPTFCVLVAYLTLPFPFIKIATSFPPKLHFVPSLPPVKQSTK